MGICEVGVWYQKNWRVNKLHRRAKGKKVEIKNRRRSAEKIAENHALWKSKLGMPFSDYKGAHASRGGEPL